MGIGSQDEKKVDLGKLLSRLGIKRPVCLKAIFFLSFKVFFQKLSRVDFEVFLYSDSTKNDEIRYPILDFHIFGIELSCTVREILKIFQQKIFSCWILSKTLRRGDKCRLFFFYCRSDGFAMEYSFRRLH